MINLKNEKMKNFRTDLIEKIEEKLQNIDTDYCGGVSDPNYFIWENLEKEDYSIEINWDMDDDDAVIVSLQYDYEEQDSLEYESLEEAIENIDDILDFFRK